MKTNLTKDRFHLGMWLLRLTMRLFIFLVCTTVFGLSTDHTFSQTKVTIPQDQLVTVDEVFEIIRQQTNYRFMYPKNMFGDAPKVPLKKGTIRVDRLLNQSIEKNRFNLVLSADNVIIVKENSNRTQRQVSGKITDESGLPIVGATVLIKGTTRGTSTDFNGEYAIAVPNPENVLVFSALGFTTHEVIVGNQPTVNVMLRENVSELNEVVLNAGYYKTSKKQATGSISKIDGIDVETQPVINPLNALQGRIPGVQIRQTNNVPGAAPTIFIRGRNSIREEGNYPLYIIDGVPVSSVPVSGSGLLALGIDPLNTLNLSNIDKVEVLKDADATSIYGSRGANGVVLITTKKGVAGRTDFNINAYTGFGEISNKIDVLNTEQYLEMRREAFENDGAIPSEFNAPDLTLWNQNRETDWQEVLLGNTSYITDIQTSVSGGSDNTTFLVGVGTHKETSVFSGDFGYKKVTANASISHRSKDDRFKLSLTANYGVDKNDLFYSGNFISTVVLTSPNAPSLYDEDGNLNWEDSSWYNPLGEMRKTQKIESDNLISNLFLSYELMSGLTVSSSFGHTRFYSEEQYNDPVSAYDPAIQDFLLNSSRFNSTKRRSTIIEPQLNFFKKVGNLSIEALIGGTYQEALDERLSLTAEGYPHESLIGNIASATNIYPSLDNRIEYRYNAVFGRLGLNWNQKYFVNLTGRRDGSSRFAPGKQFANFGAIGLAWIFSNENFFKDNGFLSFGKLRGSYGTTGNDKIADFGYVNAYGPTSGGGLYPIQLGDPNYSWEENKKLEVALSLGFFNDKLFFDVNHYRNRSSNQLVGFNLPAITGFTSLQANLPAVVENTGWELQVSTKNIHIGKLIWNSTLNITMPQNELTAFPNIEQSPYANLYKVGNSLESSFLYQSLGVNPETGFYEILDVNDDGAYNFEDHIINKDFGQKYYGGFHNSLALNNFKFDFFFEFVKQLGRNHLATFFVAPGRYSFTGAANQPVEVLDRWQQAGDDTDIQQYSQSFNASAPYTNIGNSDLSVTDASYIRLKTLSLSYKLPPTFLGNSVINNLEVYIQGQNLFTITGFKGLDPQSNRTGFNLPPLRVLSLGAKIQL